MKIKERANGHDPRAFQLRHLHHEMADTARGSVDQYSPALKQDRVMGAGCRGFGSGKPARTSCLRRFARRLVGLTCGTHGALRNGRAVTQPVNEQRDQSASG